MLEDPLKMTQRISEKQMLTGTLAKQAPLLRVQRYQTGKKALQRHTDDGKKSLD